MWRGMVRRAQTDVKKEIDMKSMATILFSMAVCFVIGKVAWAVPESHPGKQFLLTEEPEEAADIIPLRKEVENGQEVVVAGRIGGRKNPWIKDAAAFMLVDRSLTPCNEGRDSNCPTPWDYCCSANLARSMVLVMIIDDQGKLVRKDARELLGLRELDRVVVQGWARRDKSGNLSILASRIYVNQDETATR